MRSSLSQRDKAVIWHPYTAQKYAPDTIPVVKGEGVWLTDDNGNRFIDAISSWWVTIHGHGNAYIAERIYRQALELEQVIFAGFTHRPAVELAERLIAILPGNFSKVFYSDNGSTATEVAIKMAIQYWWNKGDKKRKKILALTNSYHGDTFGAMSVSGRSIFTSAFSDHLFDVHYTTIDGNEKDILIDGLSKEKSAELLNECACVIYEPLVQGAGGMKMYAANALNNFLEQCKEHKIICIADEVMTGFGRTGKMFASEYATQKPDIICLSKGITGGTMALGATVCADWVHDAFVDADPLKTFFHGHSFTANPLACTAALASLDLFESNNTIAEVERISKKNEDFVAMLATKQAELNISNCRTTGTIAAFEINTPQEGYINSVKEHITNETMRYGVYLRPLGNTVYIMPPYCITNEELNKVYEAIIAAVSSLK